MSLVYNMAYLFNSFVKLLCPISPSPVVQSEQRAPIIIKRQVAMNEDSSIANVEKKIDLHISKHDEDQKKLFYWAMGILLGLLGTVITGLITYGSMQEKVITIEKRQESFVTQQQFNGLNTLLDERFRNMNEKLDDIKEALSIR